METERTLTAAVLKDDPRTRPGRPEAEVAIQGVTVDEALENLREALELYVEDDEVPASFPTRS